jgi:hypothetical protein
MVGTLSGCLVQLPRLSPLLVEPSTQLTLWSRPEGGVGAASDQSPSDCHTEQTWVWELTDNVDIIVDFL